MRCRRQPRFLENRPVQISNLLEVRLAPAHWHRIRTVAGQRRRTYSTITRYCALRLARKVSLRWTARLEAATARVRQGIECSRDLHRHMMCLYGDDEKLIRLAAMDLGLTISAFVRLAIELYLGCLAMENRCRRRVTNDDLTAEGIRFTQIVQIFAVNGGPFPFLREICFHRFDLDSYW